MHANIHAKHAIAFHLTAAYPAKIVSAYTRVSVSPSAPGVSTHLAKSAWSANNAANNVQPQDASCAKPAITSRHKPLIPNASPTDIITILLVKNKKFATTIANPVLTTVLVRVYHVVSLGGMRHRWRSVGTVTAGWTVWILAMGNAVLMSSKRCSSTLRL